MSSFSIAAPPPVGRPTRAGCLSTSPETRNVLSVRCAMPRASSHEKLAALHPAVASSGGTNEDRDEDHDRQTSMDASGIQHGHGNAEERCGCRAPRSSSVGRVSSAERLEQLAPLDVPDDIDDAFEAPRMCDEDEDEDEAPGAGGRSTDRSRVDETARRGHALERLDSPTFLVSHAAEVLMSGVGCVMRTRSGLKRRTLGAILSPSSPIADENDVVAQSDDEEPRVSELHARAGQRSAVSDRFLQTEPPKGLRRAQSMRAFFPFRFLKCPFSFAPFGARANSAFGTYASSRRSGACTRT